MTVIAVVQARMNASRFPGKVLYDLNGTPILKRVIDRVRQASKVDSIIVATAGKHADDIIGHCEVWGVNWYAGDNAQEEDVLARFVSALKGAAADDWCVRVCGDNPLVVPTTIDALVQAAQTQWTVELEYTRTEPCSVVKRTCRQPDYIGYRMPNNTPAILHGLGWFAEVVRVEALERLDWELPNDDPRRQHVTQGLYGQPDKYRCEWLPLPDWYWREDCPSHVAIDTPDDLTRVAGILDDWAEHDDSRGVWK